MQTLGSRNRSRETSNHSQISVDSRDGHNRMFRAIEYVFDKTIEGNNRMIHE